MWIITSLMIFGFLLLFVEFLLTPGLGIAGILSLGSLVGGCVLTFVRYGHNAGIIVTVATIVLVLLVSLIILKSSTWKKLALKDEIDSSVDTGNERVSTGDKGVSKTRLAPMGTARFDGVQVEVKSFDGNMIAPSTPIEVVAVEDNIILVKTIA